MLRNATQQGSCKSEGEEFRSSAAAELCGSGTAVQDMTLGKELRRQSFLSAALDKDYSDNLAVPVSIYNFHTQTARRFTVAIHRSPRGAF